MAARIGDAYVGEPATAAPPSPVGLVGTSVSPLVFLPRGLVADVLDRADEFADLDPREHYALTVMMEAELTEVERNAAAAQADDIEPELP